MSQSDKPKSKPKNEAAPAKPALAKPHKVAKPVAPQNIEFKGTEAPPKHEAVSLKVAPRRGDKK